MRKRVKIARDAPYACRCASIRSNQHLVVLLLTMYSYAHYLKSIGRWRSVLWIVCRAPRLIHMRCA